MSTNVVQTKITALAWVFICEKLQEEMFEVEWSSQLGHLFTENLRALYYTRTHFIRVAEGFEKFMIASVLSGGWTD